MVDRSLEEISLETTGRALGRRIAVASGCFVALVSLIQHVPASIAALRGASAFAAVLVIASLGLFALRKSLAADLRVRDGEGEPRA